MSFYLPIDHFVVLVSNLEAARQSFMDAGFAATVITRHSEAMGTANSCIMLQGNYVELMGMVDETPANEGWRALLASGPGLRGIALASSDVEATSATLAAKHIRAAPPLNFSRLTAEGELRFSVVRLPRDLTPGLQCIYCQHHTPDLLWTPQAMTHPNGATRIVEASVPGALALKPLESDKSGIGALPVRAAAMGSIAVETREPISKACTDAIALTSGIHIETKAGA